MPVTIGTLNGAVARGSGLRTPSRGTTLSMTELVSVVNSRYKRSVLRRKTLPKGFCYVCSRVDPSGIFRNPNSHLFRKGFFHKGSCEHFPRAPYSTFIADGIGESIQEEDPELLNDETDAEIETPSIAVTIKRTSVAENYGKQYYELAELQSSVDGSRTEKDQNKVFKLPPMFGHGPGSNMAAISKDTGRLLPITSEQSFISAQRRRDESEEDLIARLNRHAARSEMSITFRNTMSSQRGGGSASDSSFHLPAINNSGRAQSSPTPGQGGGVSGRVFIPSGSEALDIKDDFNSATSISSLQPGQETRHRPASNGTVPLIINSVDGLNASNTTTPIFNDLTALDASVSNRNRPKGGRLREHKTNDNGSATTNTTTTENGRPGSGHLRYHHRSSADDVPSQGFVVPKTPTEAERLEIEQELKNIERVELENKTERSSKMLTDDDESIMLSDSASLALRGLVSGGSFCRCASQDRLVRVNSKHIELCQVCGKNVHHRSPQRSSRVAGERGTDGNSSQRSKNVRENMLYGHSRARDSRTVSDEDYMDMKSIILEDEGRYFTSEEGLLTASFATTTSSIRRYRDAKPYPLVDPDMHKEAYLRALNAVQTKGLNKRGNDVDDFNALKKLSRPAFSYFQLWPFAGKCSECGNIGIRPNDQPVPKASKKTSLMKHIFGDVTVDEFYPAGKNTTNKKVIPRNVVHDSTKVNGSKDRQPPVSLKYKGQK